MTNVHQSRLNIFKMVYIFIRNSVNQLKIWAFTKQNS